MHYEPKFFAAPDGTEMAILTRADYDRLIEAAEDRIDIADAKRILAEDRFLVPGEVVDAVHSGVSPIAAWRAYRDNMSQAYLAELIGTSQAAIARLETRKNGKLPYGRQTTRRAIAFALGVPVWAIDPDEI